MISGLSLVYGVGINDADYQLSKSEKINGKYVKVWKCPFYQTWVSMLERGYSLRFKAKYPTYLNVVVCDEWLTFSKFRKWMTAQDWEGNHLDKDLLGFGLVYSEENCRFIPPFVNTCLSLSDSIRGGLPLGVSLYYTNKGEARYLSMIKDRRGKVTQRNLGRSGTIMQAHSAWQHAKIEIMKGVLVDYLELPCYDLKVGEALSNRIGRLSDDLKLGIETKSFNIN
jgi:hypothetical protein